MSQYYWDAATGSVDDWVKRTEVGSFTLDIVDDGGVQALRWSQATNNRTMASLDAVPDAADIEIVVFVRRTALGTGRSTGIAGRVSGATSATSTAYVHMLNNELGHGGIRCTRYINGTSSNPLPETTGAVTDVTTYHWRKFRINGTSLQGKIWDGLITDEPAGWDFSVSDTGISAAGWTGLYGFENGTDYYQIVSIGINGSPAPTEPVASGGWNKSIFGKSVAKVMGKPVADIKKITSIP